MDSRCVTGASHRTGSQWPLRPAAPSSLIFPPQERGQCQQDREEQQQGHQGEAQTQLPPQSSHQAEGEGQRSGSGVGGPFAIPSLSVPLAPEPCDSRQVWVHKAF